MSTPLSQTAAYYGSPTLSAAERNRVLRNTYWLLALSMIPTVLGAWIGVSTGLARAMSPGIGLVVFLVGSFGLMFAIEKTKNSAAGVPVLLAFTFFMGLMLSRLIGAVLGLSNGANLIMLAFAGTGGVFFAMATLSSVIKRDLSSHGSSFLFIGAIVLLVAGIANIFLQSSALMLARWPCWRSASSRPSSCTTSSACSDGRRDQLHHRHPGRVPQPVQRVPVAAGHLRPDQRRQRRLIGTAVRVTETRPPRSGDTDRVIPPRAAGYAVSFAQRNAGPTRVGVVVRAAGSSGSAA
jgi:modulator of FtsH protease